MDMRNNWTIDPLFNVIENNFYSKEETLSNVVENFEIHRWYTNEGYDIEINGITERCVVQTSSNPLRDLNDFRKIQCPITADVKRGYYVNFENSIWLIDTNVVNVDGAYLSTRMSRCQYVLRWQDLNGRIIEKYGYSADMTKYSNGEYGNYTITTGDNQYSLLLPIDDDTKKLKRGMRFAVDFDDTDRPDVYELTNRKVKLNDETLYNRGGTISIALSLRLFDESRDKRVALPSGLKTWICDYREMNVEKTDSNVNNNLLEQNYKLNESHFLRFGQWKTFSVDIEGNYRWNIDCNFKNDILIKNNDDCSIILRINNDKYIGKSFNLELIVNENIASIFTIEITEGF